MSTLICAAYFLLVCASCAALTRWEQRRAKRRLSTPEKWAYLLRGASRWK